MKLRRRIILQMTPLLDMLLTVIFAQYMDLQTASRRMLRQEQYRRLRTQAASLHRLQGEQDQRRLAEALRDQALGQMRQVTDQLGPLVEERERLKAHGEQLALKHAALEKEAQALRKENQELAGKLDENLATKRKAIQEAQELARKKAELKAQQDIEEVGGIFREMLNIDDKHIKTALSGRSVEEIDKISQEFKELKDSQQAAAIIRHLRKAVEFRKRCDFWEFHVAADDSVRIKIRGKLVEPKLFFRNADDFTAQVLDLIKRQEDPKDMVLILYSYGMAPWATRKTVQRGLNNVVSFLDAYWKRSRRVHVADLGYTAEAP